MNGHMSDIKHNRNKPVAKQFNKPDYTLENLRLTVIKKVKKIITTSQNTKNCFQI